MTAAFDWFFRSRKTGRVTIAQFPNIALWIFFATAVLRRIVPADNGAHNIVVGVGIAALSWWAGDELARGVNPWRRVLGAAALTLTLVSLVRIVR